MIYCRILICVWLIFFVLTLTLFKCIQINITIYQMSLKFCERRGWLDSLSLNHFPILPNSLHRIEFYTPESSDSKRGSWVHVLYIDLSSYLEERVTLNTFKKFRLPSLRNFSLLLPIPHDSLEERNIRAGIVL